MYNTILENIKKDLIKKMEELSWIDDSDNSERIIDSVIDKEIEKAFDEDEKIEEFNEEYYASLYDDVQVFMKENFNIVGIIHKNGDFEGYYYIKNLNFSDIEEFKKHFDLM